jgi:indolepyruvate ferredoxin oxidoreductase
VAQILSTAAMFDRWDIHGLDQTGLSQKAGPVISDIIITRSGTASNLVGDGQADVLLGFDGMVAAADGTIGAADQNTAIVVSTNQTPTGRMVAHPDIAYPADQISERLRTSDRLRQLDASRLSEALVGTTAAANILLLGVAVQAGLIPVSVDSIERAIELNGVAVDSNLAALDWGRRWAHDAEIVERLAGLGRSNEQTVDVPGLTAELRAVVAELGLSADDSAVVEMLAADLVAYQNTAYARSFLDSVAETVAAGPGIETAPLTMAVARNLHKLMAYKDEYEVARLMLGPEGKAVAESVGGKDAKITWHLHPPMLKALGLDDKVAVGQWAVPALRALRAGKRLRGTRFDPFGRMEMRRVERALIDEYRSAMTTVNQSLAPALGNSDRARVDAAVAIASLPDQIRGYEDLKLRRISEYRTQLQTSLQDFQ